MAEKDLTKTEATAAAAAALPTGSGERDTLGGTAAGAPTLGTNEEITVKSGEYIQAIGPSDPTNNAAALRYTLTDENGEAGETIQIERGQRLKVGSAKDADLSVAQAKTLLGLGIWSFQKINE